MIRAFRYVIKAHKRTMPKPTLRCDPVRHDACHPLVLIVFAIVRPWRPPKNPRVWPLQNLPPLR